jgi:colicin import membrane protein
MRQFSFRSVLILALTSCATTAQALTPLQSATTAKAKADALAKTKLQAQTKAKADAATRARSDALTKAKARFISALSVRVETQRRSEAAMKAAVANAQVTSFRSPSAVESAHNSVPRLDAAASKAHVPDAAKMKSSADSSHPGTTSNAHVAAGSSHSHASAPR